MTDPLRIDIPLVLPEVTDAADRCVGRLLADLISRRRPEISAEGLGIDRADIDRAEDMYRARDKERLRLQFEAGDIRAARALVAAQQPWDDRGTRGGEGR